MSDVDWHNSHEKNVLKQQMTFLTSATLKFKVGASM